MQIYIKINEKFRIKKFHGTNIDKRHNLIIISVLTLKTRKYRFNSSSKWNKYLSIISFDNEFFEKGEHEDQSLIDSFC